MKNSRFSIMLDSMFYISLPSVCIGVALYIASCFGLAVTTQQIMRYSLFSLGGVLLFISLTIMIWTGQQHSKKNRAYFNFFEEVEATLDRIAKCDFNVEINTEPYRDARYYSEQIIDLVEKVNVMARELNGMETMRQDFISNVSHEIQSPLTSIRGYMSLMKDEDLSKEERTHYVEIIESESLRLSKLSENLLRLSTLDSEFAVIKPRSYLLNRQLKDIMLLLEAQWSKKNIEVSFAGEAVNIIADEDLLSQVWINLLNNSIKFTPANGKILISITDLGNQIQVMIADNGIGMTKDTMAHIYERFYMADKSRNRAARGNGLGLSIVKKIVDMHNGSINVESTPAEGTTFTIILPAALPNKNALSV